MMATKMTQMIPEINPQPNTAHGGCEGLSFFGSSIDSFHATDHTHAKAGVNGGAEELARQKTASIK